MNNKYQELIAEKMSDFESAFSSGLIPKHEHDIQGEEMRFFIEKTLQDTIDTVSMIVREEEAVEYNKIIDTVLAEKGSYADGYLQGKFDAQMDNEQNKNSG